MSVGERSERWREFDDINVDERERREREFDDSSEMERDGESVIKEKWREIE